MASFLFVVPPLTGHVNPTVSVAAELRAAGHEVAWVGHPTVVRALLPAGATFNALDDRIPQKLHEEMVAKSRSARGLAALKFLWEDFLVPLGRAMVPGVAEVVERERPDVLVVDQQALAGGVVARRARLPWATLSTTSAAVAPDAYDDLPKVEAWVEDQLAAFQKALGLAPLPGPGHNCSPHAVVVFSTPTLVGDVARLPERFHFVGPSFRDRPADGDFPWAWLDGDARPNVLVSLGTVNAERGARFFRAVTEGLGGRALRVVLVAPPELVAEPVPDNVLVRPWVPQVALLERMAAVVCHAGHNTVAETLAHGLPLVVAPIRDDQPVVAKQVARAGAGLRLRFARTNAKALRTAVERVLAEPSFRRAAEQLRDEFASAGGAPAAARVLISLAEGGAR